MAVLMLVFAVLGFVVAVVAAVASHRSANAAEKSLKAAQDALEESRRSAAAAEDSAKEAKRANDLAERPDVTLEAGRAQDIRTAVSIAFRTDTALDSMRIKKTHTIIDGKPIHSGEWRPTFMGQSVAISMDEDGTIVLTDVPVNQPAYVTWIPWHGDEGRMFDLHLDFDIVCISGDRTWTLARSLDHHRTPPPRGY